MFKSLNKYLYKGLLKNFSKMFLGKAALKLFTLLTFVVIARFLGSEDFGNFSYLLSIVWILFLFIDLGFSELFIRDVSYQKEDLKKYFSSILILKLFLSLIFTCLIWVFLKLNLLNIKNISLAAFIFLIGSSVVDSFVDFFRSTFRAVENFRRESFFIIFESVIKFLAVLVSSFILLRLYPRLIIICAALFVASLFNSILLLFFTKENFQREYFKINLSFWAHLIKNSFPLILIYILGAINFRLSMIMLMNLVGAKSSGFFSADYKLIEQLLIIPIAFSSVLLPAFCRLSRDFFSKIKIIYARLFPQFFLLGLFFSITLVIFAPLLIRLFYGKEYADAYGALHLLAWVCAVLFVKPLFEKLLVSLKSQNIVIMIYSFGMLFNLILSYFLILRFGIFGAAAGNLLSEILIVISLVIFTRILIKRKRQDNRLLDYPVILSR